MMLDRLFFNNNPKRQLWVASYGIRYEFVSASLPAVKQKERMAGYSMQASTPKTQKLGRSNKRLKCRNLDNPHNPSRVHA